MGPEDYENEMFDRWHNQRMSNWYAQERTNEPKESVPVKPEEVEDPFDFEIKINPFR